MRSLLNFSIFLASFFIYLQNCLWIRPANAIENSKQISNNEINLSTFPQIKAEDQHWRIGYFASDDYADYPKTLRVIAYGLQQLGWINISEEIPEGLNGKELWSFLSEKTQSEYIEFVGNAWWQTDNFDTKQDSNHARKLILEELKNRTDIDLIIAMGTWAGQDMVSIGVPIPTVVTSTSDPVRAQIIKGPEDSGIDNLHARVQPERYQQQVRLFHEIAQFKKLGLVYEDSAEGKTYSAIDAVEQVAYERNFQIIGCNALSHSIPQEEAIQNVLKCYEEISPKIDAAYVTVHRGITLDSIKQIAKILLNARIPSFSMLGAEEVKEGILMSMAQADYSYVGLFYAETIARILNGAKPRELSQIWTDPAKIVLNLKTSRLIGFDPPVDILLAADDVYDDK